MWRFSLVLFLIAGNFRIVTAANVEQNYGKVILAESSPNGFYCKNISFPSPFQNGGTIRVFPSLSHENHPGNENEASTAIVTSVDQNAFSICLMEPARPTGETTLNWFAFSDTILPRGVLTGSVSYSVFTSGSTCNDVRFSSAFNAQPKILLSVRHAGRNQRKDAMSFWAEDVTESSFRVCLQEMVSFSGAHENLVVDWIALENTFSLNMTDLDSLLFPNTALPSSEDNYAYCEVQNFTLPFYEPPAILLNAQRRSNLTSALPDQNIVTWVKNVSITEFEICIKDLPGINVQHEPITVDYTAVGALDPCLDIICEKFAVCRAFGPYDGRCVCVTDCSSIEQNVCGSNGKSFTNNCLLELEICQTKANFTYYHHGSCRGFPMTRGRKHVPEVPRWSDAHCQAVQFEPLTFYPDKPVHVQISVSHVNATSQVHDAAVSWVEDVSVDNFTFCVMESGRNEGPPHGFATVEYIAYQGAPSGSLAGLVSMPEWWTGTKCQTVDISLGSFSSTPTVLVTAEHHRRNLKHDAASLWLEDVTTTSFKVCLRELQNFDGAHQDIYVNWLAFQTLELALFSEHGFGNFPHTSGNPLSSTNYAQCQNVSLVSNYTKPPTVIVSPKHSTSGENVDPKRNAISAWIESVTISSFKICFKELYNRNGYDAVAVSYVVFKEICEPSWVFHEGFCYKKKSNCDTWTNASSTCMKYSAHLVGIENAQEDVFIQHLHYGKESWIGLNDQANEGVYLWTDGSPVLYTHWAPNVSPTYSEADDCVQGSGRNLKYHWQPISCDSCRDFTCKRDFDECAENMNTCHENADCFNSVGSYSCQCRSGYTGNGHVCEDANECSLRTHFCDSNADCINTVGSYICQCRSGFSGDGQVCTEIDECFLGTYSCHSNADCFNTVGSYSCMCRSGYVGNGKSCLDANECSLGTHACNSNANCINTVGSYMCQCRGGFAGNGQVCTDISECSLGTYTCHSNAYCINTIGSYYCRCHSGYVGNGKSCQRSCGNPGSPSRGYKSGSAYTFGSTVYFYCSYYYYGEVLSGASYTTCQHNGRWSNPTPPRCSSYGIRLVGSSYANRGRVEVHHPSYGWGTVCDDAFDSNDGLVICRQLGYTGVSRVHSRAYYGQGTGTILLDQLGCYGYESYVWGCSRNSWASHNCAHSEDASVDCY